MLVSAKLPAGIFLPVLGRLGCSIQAWAANKGQLPSLDMGNTEQSCCFLDDLGLFAAPAQKFPGAGSVSLELTGTITDTSFPSRSFLILSIGTSLWCCSCCVPATETFVISPGLLCGKGFFQSLSLDPVGSGLLEPGLLRKPTWKSTDTLLFCCRLSLDVAPLDCKYFFFFSCNFLIFDFPAWRLFRSGSLFPPTISHFGFTLAPATFLTLLFVCKRQGLDID